MRGTLVLVGTLLVVVGCVWILQGAGVIGGSFMTGSSGWLVIGVVCVLSGIAVALRGSRR